VGRIRQLQTTAVEPALSGAGGGFRFRVTPFVLSIVFGPNLDELGIRGKQRPL
jgi:hypothetical protein